MSDIPIINMNLNPKNDLYKTNQNEIQQYPSDLKPEEKINEEPKIKSKTTLENEKNNKKNNSQNNKKSIFQIYSENYKKMSKKSKKKFYITLSICVSISIITSILLFIFFFLPKMQNKNYKFFCAERIIWNTDNLCFLAFGQVSFGIIAIGQISFGIFTIGQLSVGFFVIIGHISVSFIFTYISQITITLFAYINQFGLAGLFCKRSMACTSPLNVIVHGNKSVVTTGCK